MELKNIQESIKKVFVYSTFFFKKLITLKIGKELQMFPF